MYNRDKLEEYAHKIYARYEYFNNYTLETIARRLKATGRLSAYDQQALKNIADITGDMQAITKKLAEITEQSTQDIEKAYAQVVSDGVNTYKPLYDFKGMQFVPFKENDYAQQLVRHWAKETAGTMLNITKTKALCFDSYDVHGRFTGSTPLAGAYENAMTEAVTALTGGTVSFDTALAETVERLGGSGVKVDYSSGVTRELSGMVRQNILYGAKQAAKAYDEYVGAQLGCDGFEVDAHSGCRPSHEFMQGQLYAYDGTKTVDGVEYEDGTAALSALEDYGCLHFKTDIILGISQPRYSPEELERIRRETSEMIEYNGRSKTRYGWKQTQRALERAVKTELQKANMCKAAGLTRRADEHTQKAKTYRAAYDDLCTKTGLEPRYERMRVYAPSGMKTVDKNGKSDIIKASKAEAGVQDVHFVGKIDREIYKCVTENIRTDEVIITDERIQHIKERHPNDYERYFNYIPSVISNPDYIIETEKHSTAVLLKEVKNANEKFKLILRIAIKNDPTDYKNSVISFWHIGDTTWKKTLKNKKILYKSE